MGARPFSQASAGRQESTLVQGSSKAPPHQDCTGVGPPRVQGSQAPSQTLPPSQDRHKRGLCGSGASPQCSRLQWEWSQTCGMAPGWSRVGSRQTSVSTTQPKYLAHSLHPSPLPCLRLLLFDPEGADLEQSLPPIHCIPPAPFGRAMPPRPLTLPAAGGRSVPTPRSSPEPAAVLREGVRQCLQQQCEQTVRILHAKVAQKSYGNEKR